MKYYKVIIDGNEPEFPFVVKLDKKYYNKYWEIVNNGEIIKEWPDDISFYSCQDGVPATQLGNDCGWMIFSDEAIEVFNKNNIFGFQYLPVKVYTMITKLLLENYNQVANIIEKANCFDMENSKYRLIGDERPDLKGQIAVITDIVLIKDKIKENIDIFRLNECTTYIIANERFVKLYKKNKFNGLNFKEVKLV